MVSITRLLFKTKLARIAKAATGLVCMTFLFGISSAHAFTVTVVDQNGLNVTSGFRWLLEEDTSFQVTPGTQTYNSQSLDFHRSFAPVVKSGECADPLACDIPLTAEEALKQMFVSVLPFSGYNMSGNKVEVGATGVTIRVTRSPMPTARIRVQVFQDMAPVNGVADNPQEDVINTPDFDPTQFSILLEDGGGRYGHTGGQILYDVYGNKLGTTYVKDGLGNVILDVDGVPTIDVPGTGVMIPGPDGFYTIEHVAPAKYGIIIIPPAGQGWQQTSTLEGSKVIDAFVKSNEPEQYKEFGPPGPHVFVGFAKPINNYATTVGSTISGTIVDNHLSRPPVVAFADGAPVEGCWVALHPGAVGNPADYIAPCDAGGTFTIPNVPANTYQLAIWNQDLKTIIASYNVDNTAGTDINLGNIKVFDWFARMDNRVFLDANQNGFPDPGEQDMPEQAVNIRFRNGTTYQSVPTDLSGEAPFDSVFPFFHWQVAEVDFARYKATGVTYAVDNGGTIPLAGGWVTPSFGVLAPQLQPGNNPYTGNNLSTSESGLILTKSFQSFLSTTNRFAWGKAPYGPADIDNPPYGDFPGPGDIDHGPLDNGVFGKFDHGNGGISGMAIYAITRAEDDPAYTATEEWEPGLPRVQMNLYRDMAPYDKQIDDMVDGVAGFTAPDVDRYPLGNFPGVEDIDRNSDGIFDYGDAIQVVWTDSWDDNLPTGCVNTVDSPAFVAHPGVAGLERTLDCYDGLRNYNQIRDGVFDGGWAFLSRMEIETDSLSPNFGQLVEVEGLPSGFYIVEADVPPGLELLKEEDKNVDFGVAWEPIPNLLPAECVGEPHLVPQYLSFQTSRTQVDGLGNPLPIVDPAELIDAPYAGQTRPLCNRKSITLTDGANAATDFALFSDVPISANAVGQTLNDLANQFDPANPNFGEKAAPSWLPVVFRDWTGQEIARTHLDEYGHYNGRLPSTFSVNLPFATGVSPNMITGCVNDATGADPYYNPQYSTSCFTFQYMPGSTTYLDTPVVPIAAFAGQGDFPVDCELPTATPMIASVSSVSGGPFISDTAVDRTLTIVSRGAAVEVLNHAYPNAGEPKTIPRDYSFGAARGVVKLGNTTLAVTSWTADEIVVNVPLGTAEGDLMVTTAAGKTTELGVHVSLFDDTAVGAPVVHTVVPSAVADATPIQDAIDAAADGDLILIAPGEYSELVIMYKPVQLQGYGAYTSIINSSNAALTKFGPWNAKIAAEALNYDLVEGQVAPILQLEQGPGITVLGKTGAYALYPARIDGLTIKNALDGGGILVNGHATGLRITNNVVASNEGTFGGGIRVGHPNLTVVDPGPDPRNSDADNDNMVISHNIVTQNGTSVEGGGGISIYTGADNYAVTDNLICGNFTQGSGAGMLHLGFSNNGTIAHNDIIFNQSFQQMANVHGGGLALMGKTSLAGVVSNGTGALQVDGNLIQGNHAGAGHGGGMYVYLSMLSPVNIVNNMVVNNVSGWAAGGIALADSGNVAINHNTIANNDSMSTVGALLLPDLSGTTRTPGAGIASFAHSTPDVVAEIGDGSTFSNPELINNIVFHNRSFNVTITTTQVVGLIPDVGAGALPDYSDLAVIGVAGSLSPVNTLTSLDVGSVGFLGDYTNESAGTHPVLGDPTALTTPAISAAFDEGGNLIDIRYGPLTPTGNYHLAATSPAIGAGAAMAQPALDFDGNDRNRTAYAGLTRDIGADEVVADTDGDGVTDDLDNCINASNAHQYDFNGDGFGNQCDADLNSTNTVNFVDFGIFRSRIGTTDAEADFDNNGFVNFIDYGIFRLNIGSAPGPSGLTP